MNTTKPKISVITPVYNGEQYFDRAVPSILRQTYTNFEYIIVDDGSTDKTPDFLKELAHRDSRVRVLSPGRLGFTRALNHAIETAQGDYIARQDFDDLSYPQRLRSQLEFLEANPKIGMVGSYYILVNDGRQERHVGMPPTEHHKLVRTMATCIPFVHSLVTFRKEAWRQAGGYPHINDGVEDLRLWLTFVKLGWQVANIPEVLGEHWVHSDSFFYQNVQYRQRQKILSELQWQVVCELGLPLWMGVYPLGRYIYPYLPTSLKRFVRRQVVGYKEQYLAFNSEI
ncbi:glycosyltransferase family 2 protein [Chlorogloeopsis sp. ULAP02]|uniref:glycosyltransferase family 2 protein n=1 Tax=Chlorogloeopsis sp. ULAP02 TaxID=3107926 RepID=UPI0031355E0D